MTRILMLFFLRHMEMSLLWPSHRKRWWSSLRSPGIAGSFFRWMWWTKWLAKASNYEKKMKSRKQSRKIGVSKKCRNFGIHFKYVTLCHKWWPNNLRFVQKYAKPTWEWDQNSPWCKRTGPNFYNYQHKNASTKVTWLLEQVSNIPNGVPSRKISTYLTLWLDPICLPRYAQNRIGGLTCSFLYVSSSRGLFAILRTSHKEMKTCS